MLASLDNHHLKDRLVLYEKLLLKWSHSLNLVAKSTLPHVWERHFQDSLQLVSFLSPEDKIIDLGSGAGFPGMVLAMGGFDVTLVECDQKKCVFLHHVSRETQTPVKIINSRLELYKPSHMFDVVTSRGLASLAKLINISSHVVKRGLSKGFFLKGENVERELEEGGGLDLDRVKKIPSATCPDAYIIEYQY